MNVKSCKLSSCVAWDSGRSDCQVMSFNASDSFTILRCLSVAPSVSDPSCKL
jgi:hypothetical protein